MASALLPLPRMIRKRPRQLGLPRQLREMEAALFARLVLEFGAAAGYSRTRSWQAFTEEGIAASRREPPPHTVR